MVATLIAFAFGSAVGIAAGYALAVVLVSGWSFSFTVRHGIWRALRAKNLMDFYEKSARNEREVYALHFVEALREVGGPSAPVPRTKAGIDSIFRIAEMRMDFDKRKRWYTAASWRD